MKKISQKDKNNMVPIKGHPNYFSTRDGKIISTNKSKEGKELNGSDHKGYLRISLWNDEKKFIREMAHRLVAKTFIPNPLNKPEVNHIDGNRKNNNINNLEWCDRSENMIDTVKRKTHNTTKLSIEHVLEIRKLYKSGNLTKNDLAIAYNTTSSNIYRIINRLTWKFI